MLFWPLRGFSWSGLVDMRPLLVRGSQMWVTDDVHGDWVWEEPDAGLEDIENPPPLPGECWEDDL